MKKEDQIKSKDAKKILEQVLLMMNYNSSLTLKENINNIKEQEGRGSSLELDPEVNKKISTEKNKKKENFDEKYIVFPVPWPNQFNQKNILVPKNGRYNFYTENVTAERIFKSWLTTPSLMPKEILSKTNGLLKSFVTPDNIWWTPFFTVTNTNDGIFYWYCNNEEYKKNNSNLIPYDYRDYLEVEIPEEYVEDFWEKWGGWILTSLSLLAAATIPGMQGLVISALIDMVVVAESLAKGDNFGALVSVLLAFAPFLSASIKGLGRFSKEEIQAVARQFARAETEAEVKAIYKRLKDDQKIIVNTVLSQEPKMLMKAIDENIWKYLEDGIKRGVWDKRDLVNILNKLIREKKVTLPQAAKWWQKNPNLARFGIDLGASGFIVLGSVPVKQKIEIQKLEKKFGDSTFGKPKIKPKELTQDEIQSAAESWEEDIKNN